MQTVFITVRPEKQDDVIKGTNKIINTIAPYFKNPIIGKRENEPAHIYLIYQGVENYQEVALTAMVNGASTVSFS